MNMQRPTKQLAVSPVPAKSGLDNEQKRLYHLATNAKKAGDSTLSMKIEHIYYKNIIKNIYTIRKRLLICIL